MRCMRSESEAPPLSNAAATAPLEGAALGVTVKRTTCSAPGAWSVTATRSGVAFHPAGSTRRSVPPSEESGPPATTTFTSRGFASAKRYTP